MVPSGELSPTTPDADAPQSPLSLPSRQKLFDFAIYLGLIVSIVIVYAQVIEFDFVNFDDPVYVFQNAHVIAGFTRDGLHAAFFTRVANNWAPLTLLSHTLDAQLFGLQSGWHHVVNVCFHILSALLLYALLLRAKLARGPSAFVAFVFALHPLHVESVAWVSERKDVLSTFLWFLALYAYIRYAERPAWARYLVVAAAFSLGLLAKGMLVTFPFVLLLLDVWPLRRAQWPKTIWEKLPLFAISFISSGITYWAQKGTGAMSPLPLSARIPNAVLSYVLYLGQTIWPVRLACFYPMSSSIAAWQIAGAIAILAGVSAWAIYVRKTRPYVGVGWFWYLGTLVPVIGFVQVGSQAHADRYMYVPMVGLSIMLAFTVADAVADSQWAKRVAAGAAVVLCAACLLLAHTQTGTWRNSGTLFEHALASTAESEVIENNLGAYLMSVQRPYDAVAHFEAAVRIKPGYSDAQSNLGAALIGIDGCAAGIPHLETALRLDPHRADTNLDIGVCMLDAHDYASAASYFDAAIRIQPKYYKAHRALGTALSKIPGRTQEAITHLEIAQASSPDPDTAKLLESLHAKTD